MILAAALLAAQVAAPLSTVRDVVLPAHRTTAVAVRTIPSQWQAQLPEGPLAAIVLGAPSLPDALEVRAAVLSVEAIGTEVVIRIRNDGPRMRIKAGATVASLVIVQVATWTSGE